MRPLQLPLRARLFIHGISPPRPTKIQNGRTRNDRPLLLPCTQYPSCDLQPSRNRRTGQSRAPSRAFGRAVTKFHAALRWYGSKDLVKTGRQRFIDVFHAGLDAQFGEAGNPAFDNPTRYDRPVVLEIGCHIQR